MYGKVGVQMANRRVYTWELCLYPNAIAILGRSERGSREDVTHSIHIECFMHLHVMMYGFIAVLTTVGSYPQPVKQVS